LSHEFTNELFFILSHEFTNELFFIREFVAGVNGLKTAPSDYTIYLMFNVKSWCVATLNLKI